jgi:hypothetical protein
MLNETALRFNRYEEISMWKTRSDSYNRMLHVYIAKTDGCVVWMSCAWSSNSITINDAVIPAGIFDLTFREEVFEDLLNYFQTRL